MGCLSRNNVSSTLVTKEQMIVALTMSLYIYPRIKSPTVVHSSLHPEEDQSIFCQNIDVIKEDSLNRDWGAKMHNCYRKLVLKDESKNASSADRTSTCIWYLFPLHHDEKFNSTCSRIINLYSKEWINAFISSFSTLRSKLCRV